MTDRPAAAQEGREGQDVELRLIAGLRAAVLAIAATVLLTASLPRKLDLHRPLWPQVVAYAVLLVVLAGEGILQWRRRSWGRLRGPALVAVLAAAALSTWTLAPGLLGGTADWMWGTFGWVALVVLFDGPIAALVAVLALHQADLLVRALAGGPDDPQFFLFLLAGAVGTLGFPLASGIGAYLVRQVAARAREAVAERARIEDAEELAARIAENRRERLAEVTASVGPLLTGLAEGRLHPAGGDVRRRSALAAARLRRLIAASDRTPDPLLHELRAGADVAERRGVEMQVHAIGSWPPPPPAVRIDLTDPVFAVLATARSQARITVVGTPGEVSVSVLADGEADGFFDRDDPRVTVRDGLVWMEVRWTPT